VKCKVRSESQLTIFPSANTLEKRPLHENLIKEILLNLESLIYILRSNSFNKETIAREGASSLSDVVEDLKEFFLGKNFLA